MADGREILDGLQDKHRLEAARREQDLIRGIGVLASQSVPAAAPVPEPFGGLHEDAGKPLHELFDTFLADRPQTERRHNEYLNELDRWRRSVGDKPVAEIRRRDVDQYHDLILKEIKPRKGATVVPHDTQNKALSCIRTMLQWACDTERRPEPNPATRVRPKGVAKSEKTRQKRRPFTREELQKIFSAPLYTGSATRSGYSRSGDMDMSDDGRYWLGLAALMTGARLGELTALRTSDIVVVGEATYLNITTEIGDEDDEEDRKRTLKTASSQRMLPVHPELVRLGFMDWVERRRRRADDGLLFEERDYGKYFNHQGRFFDSLGIKSDLTSFHSFRHTFKDMLRAVRDSDLRDRLMGHAPRSVGETYGSPLTEHEVQDFFERVTSPVDLSHLYGRRGKSPDNGDK